MLGENLVIFALDPKLDWDPETFSLNLSFKLFLVGSMFWPKDHDGEVKKMYLV